MAGTGLKLGFLDKSPVRTGTTLKDAFQESLETARIVEGLGYSRYWFAEHHNNPRFGCSAPEVMISQVLARTKSLIVGSGGIMIANYSSYKMAEVFSLLAALYPGRVELGFGLGHGMDPNLLPFFLKHPEDLSRGEKEKIVENLVACLRQDVSALPSFLKHSPMGYAQPNLWLLGNSENSAMLAGRLGINFCYGHLQTGFNPGPLQRFRASNQDKGLGAMLAIHVVSYQDEREYEMQIKNLCLGLIPHPARLHAPWPSRDEAACCLVDDRSIANIKKYVLIAHENDVKDRIRELVNDYGATDLMVETIGFDFASKIRILAGIAELAGEGSACAV